MPVWKDIGDIASSFETPLDIGVTGDAFVEGEGLPTLQAPTDLREGRI